MLAIALFGAGSGLSHFRPELGTSGLQFLVWGFFVSTVAVYHATFAGTLSDFFWEPADTPRETKAATVS
jgi:stearoyl-CoA desaturase (Delta-9 desaturase)